MMDSNVMTRQGIRNLNDLGPKKTNDPAPAAPVQPEAVAVPVASDAVPEAPAATAEQG
jgi:hypothetical protein